MGQDKLVVEDLFSFLNIIKSKCFILLSVVIAIASFPGGLIFATLFVNNFILYKFDFYYSLLYSLYWIINIFYLRLLFSLINYTDQMKLKTHNTTKIKMFFLVVQLINLISHVLQIGMSAIYDWKKYQQNPKAHLSTPLDHDRYGNVFSMGPIGGWIYFISYFFLSLLASQILILLFYVVVRERYVITDNNCYINGRKAYWNYFLSTIGLLIIYLILLIAPFSLFSDADLPVLALRYYGVIITVSTIYFISRVKIKSESDLLFSYENSDISLNEITSNYHRLEEFKYYNSKIIQTTIFTIVLMLIFHLYRFETRAQIILTNPLLIVVVLFFPLEQLFSNFKNNNFTLNNILDWIEKAEYEIKINQQPEFIDNDSNSNGNERLQQPFGLVLQNDIPRNLKNISVNQSIVKKLKFGDLLILIKLLKQYPIPINIKDTIQGFSYSSTSSLYNRIDFLITSDFIEIYENTVKSNQKNRLITISESGISLIKSLYQLLPSNPNY